LALDIQWVSGDGMSRLDHEGVGEDGVNSCQVNNCSEKPPREIPASCLQRWNASQRQRRKIESRGGITKKQSEVAGTTLWHHYYKRVAYLFYSFCSFMASARCYDIISYRIWSALSSLLCLQS